MIPSCPCAGEPVDELPLSSDDQQCSPASTFPFYLTDSEKPARRAARHLPPLTTSQCLTILNTAVLP